MASRDTVVIFDLFSLHESPLLEQALAPILQSGHILKVGCCVGDDMKKAAKTCPSLKAFQQVRGVVDLQPLFAQHMQEMGRQVCMHAVLGRLILDTCSASLKDIFYARVAEFDSCRAAPASSHEREPLGHG